MNKNVNPWGCETPTLTAEDAERLNPVRANGATLWEYLKSGEATREDLMRLIMLEYRERGYRRREYILTRLYARLGIETKANANFILTEALKHHE